MGPARVGLGRSQSGQRYGGPGLRLGVFEGVDTTKSEGVAGVRGALGIAAGATSPKIRSRRGRAGAPTLPREALTEGAGPVPWAWAFW